MSELKPCPQGANEAVAFFKRKYCENCVENTVVRECMRECPIQMAISALRAQPVACEIAEYTEDCKDCGFCAQPANESLTKISEMLEQAAQDMDDKCRQWQCVLQRVHDAGTFDQNSGLWVGIDKEREAKAQANFEAYRYALGVIDKIAEHVSNSYKSAHKPLTHFVSLDEIYRVIAGHSNYHGDAILSALTCISEGKQVNPVAPISSTIDSKPLTLGEMRQWLRKPTWITADCMHGWQICYGRRARKRHGKYVIDFGNGLTMAEDDYGKTWLAYAHKPGGEQK